MKTTQIFAPWITLISVLLGHHIFWKRMAITAPPFYWLQGMVTGMVAGILWAL